jgi:hypothetical protein
MKNLGLRIKNEKLKAVGYQSRFSILNSQFLILCLSMLFCSVATADSLKFKFAPGDKYSLVSVTEQKVAMVVDGNEQASEQTTQLECNFDVEEVDESGCAWAKYTYKRITMKLRAAKQKVDFDSDANQAKTPMQAAPFRLAMGEVLYLRVTPQGRIEKINGLQALITSAKAKMGNFAGADKVSQSITQLFAEPAVRRQIEDQLMIFPEPALRSFSGAGPNEPDTTWSRTRILSSAEAGYFKAEQVEDVNLVFEKTFRLTPKKSGQNGVAVVDVNLVIKPGSAPVLSTSPNPGRDALQQRDGRAQASESTVRSIMEVLGGGGGQIEIEEATGRIISSKMTQDTTERVINIAQGPILRPPPALEPITRHTVTTFQMARRQPPVPSKVEGPVPPAPSSVEGSKDEGDKPARPADANEKSPPAARPS